MTFAYPQCKAGLMIGIRVFWNSEQGQDLTEWALLVALVVLGSAALMLNTGPSVAKVWTATSSTLNLAASPSSPSSNTPVNNPPAGNLSQDGGGDRRDGGDGGGDHGGDR